MNNSYALTSTDFDQEISNHYIVFELKDNHYAIDIHNVIEVINIPQIEVPQNTPSGVIGIFNYNGNMIKVVDLCPLIGFEPNSFTINNQLIIVCSEDVYFAVHTEKIINIVQGERNQIQPLPYNVSNSILREVYKTEDSSINIVDVNKIEEVISNTETNTSKVNYLELFPRDEKSQQILNLRAELNRNAQEIFSFPVNMETINQYILFELDSQNYYLDLKYIKEFISLKRLNITKLPYTKDFIKGIINLKGDFLVVLDLKKFLNNDRDGAKEGTKLIIVEGHNFNLAILVDEIKFIKTLKDINLSEMSTSNSSSYISHEFMEENELYSILNFEKIINDERLYINIK